MKTCSTCGKEYPDDTRFCPDDGTTLRSTGTADLVGSVVADRYHITGKLGEGGMGAVYLGEHVKMGRKSAIKVISQSMAQDTEAIARFNREAANAAQINHPNVCGIYDFGETPDGLIYLAMEFIEGEALTDLLKREGALSPRRAADILQQSAAALQAAHDLGIVHRDLKPDNIMVTRGRDNADLVKVVDFGIAKAMGGDTDQKVTKTGLVVGTPEYMSPEQLSGDTLDGRSDIYSLGLVLFRMLTGVLPFQAESSQEVMIKRLTDDPMRLSEALPDTDFPPALQAALDRALERMPSDRYTSASQFGRDVVASVQHMADVAPRVDVDGATQKFEGARASATEALPGTMVTEGAGGGGDAVTAKPPTTPAAGAGAARTTRTEPKTARKAPIGVIAASVAALAVGGIGTTLWLSRGATPDTPNPGQDTSGVTQDTDIPVIGANTARPGNTNPRPSDSGPPPPVSGGSDTGGGSPTTQTTDPNPPEDQPAPTGSSIPISLEDPQERVLDLMIATEGVTNARVLTAIRDTATAYHDNPQVPTAVRADAAYVTAITFQQQARTADAIRWLRIALDLNPDLGAAKDLLTRLQGGSA